MAITVYVGGVDRSSWVDWSSLEVTQAMGAEVDSCRFSVRNYGSRSAPSIGDLVGVYDAGVAVFGGVITSIGYQWEAGLPYLAIEASDFGCLFDRYLVATEYHGEQATFCINNIVADSVNKYRKVIASFEDTETWTQET